MESASSIGDTGWMNFGENWCPAGLLSALSVCAAVHAHLARVDQGQEREEEEPQLNIDWATALGYWPTRLPEDCTNRTACLPYLEGLLAYPVMIQAAPCLEDSRWPITSEEVHDNSIRWLVWLWTRTADTPPPRWRGQSGAQRVRHALQYEAAGAFAGTRRAVPGDRSGATDLLKNVAKPVTSVCSTKL